MLIAEFNRPFELWAYTPSHSQLLFRGNKSAQHPSRFEVLFFGVSFLTLTMGVEELRIEEEVSLPAGLRGDVGFEKAHGRVYRLSRRTHVAWICARGVKWHEDQLEFNEPSGLLRPPYVRP